MVDEKKVWDSIQNSNIYPEYLCRKTLSQLGYQARRSFYSYADQVGSDHVIHSREIDIIALKTIEFAGHHQSKRQIGTNYALEINLTGDVKYNTNLNPEMAIVGILTELNDNWYNSTNKKKLVKWIPFVNERVFVKFEDWKIPFVDDYYIYPSKVNNELYSEEQYDAHLAKSGVPGLSSAFKWLYRNQIPIYLMTFCLIRANFHIFFSTLYDFTIFYYFPIFSYNFNFYSELFASRSLGYFTTIYWVLFILWVILEIVGSKIEPSLKPNGFERQLQKLMARKLNIRDWFFSILFVYTCIYCWYYVSLL